LKLDPRKPLAPPNGFGRHEGWVDLFAANDASGWIIEPPIQSGGGATNRGPLAVSRDEGIELQPSERPAWTHQPYGDLELHFEWRWADQPTFTQQPLLGADGEPERGDAGVVLQERVLSAGEGGLLLRGPAGFKVKLSCHPEGSGAIASSRELEVGEAKRAIHPRQRSDRPVGQWNRMEIKLRADVLAVKLNGIQVIEAARLPGLAA